MRKLSLFLLTLLWAQAVYASSSIFGFGPNLIGTYQYQYSTSALGRGGYEMAYMDSVNLNQMNFATWAYLSRTTVTINMSYQGMNIESQTGQSQFDSKANFNGGYIAWPLIQRKMTLGIGLAPLSVSDLGVQLQNVGVGAKGIQTVNSLGTISEAKIVFAMALSKNMGFAIVPSFTFGLIKDQIRINFDDAAYGDVAIENRYQFSGFGVAGNAYLNFWDFLALGAKIKIPSHLTVRTEQISIVAASPYENTRSVTLPFDVVIGANLKLWGEWQLGGDLAYQNWHNGYLVDNKALDNINDGIRIGVGIERGPEEKKYTSYFKNVNLRGGAFVSQLNSTSLGETINEYGLTFGLGFPIIKNQNRIDLAFEFGQRGDLGLNFLREMFFRFNFSLSTNELWFVQQER
jgi:hypothetical protein